MTEVTQCSFTAEELLDAMKTLYSMPSESIYNEFKVSRQFHNKGSLIKYVLENNSADQIVNRVSVWTKTRVFNKDDIVRNLNSKWYSIITRNDGKEIHMVDFNGVSSKHDAASFERWFEPTGKTYPLGAFLEMAKGGLKDIE